MHVNVRHKMEFLSHPIQLTIKLTVVTIYHQPTYYFPQGFCIALHTPNFATVIHFRLQNLCSPLLEFIQTYFRMLWCTLYEWRGALWGGVNIVYYCARCARSTVPWKKSGSNKSNLQWWRTLPRLMFWNKRFKATVWTICEVNLWIYGQLLKLKAFL